MYREGEGAVPRGPAARGRAVRWPMAGWFVPPPRAPVKSDGELRRERESKVAEPQRRGLLRSEGISRAMLTVRREDFIPSGTATVPTRRRRGYRTTSTG